jgi:hypothetical protein
MVSKILLLARRYPSLSHGPSLRTAQADGWDCTSAIYLILICVPACQADIDDSLFSGMGRSNGCSTHRASWRSDHPGCGRSVLTLLLLSSIDSPDFVDPVAQLCIKKICANHATLDACDALLSTDYLAERARLLGKPRLGIS